MGIGNRTATCDVCDATQAEEHFGVGWPGWTIVQGIGAQAPVEGTPIDKINMETYVCPKHREQLSSFINMMQESES